MMEAEYDQFKIIPEYLAAVPRSSDIQQHAIDLNLIKRGQLKPITVRRKDMGILDGYTRYDLLSQRGKRIKYTFMDFETPEEEMAFVVESNIMKRHLNIFQRVETVMGQLKHEREVRRMMLNQSYTDFMISINNKNTTVNKMVIDMGVGIKYVNRILKKMIGEWYLSRTRNPKNTREMVYKVAPKGEERLSKMSELKRMGKLNIIDIGVHKYTIVKAMYLIEHGKKEMLMDLRGGKVGVFEAYRIIKGRPLNRGYGLTKLRWGKYTKIQCPCGCGHIGTKDQYIKVD